ncbi:hypothetical protein [Streptomyces tailanensis]|uniref:hypothetical protein n=1 Tax=Streptomyces tailanensis TaxID=2569858 RepID=UPI00122E6ED1|nr:hypothetical protein [Streptomyces tailanensis]
MWRAATDHGRSRKARDIVRIAWDRPFADVLVLLRDPELRAGFLSGGPAGADGTGISVTALSTAFAVAGDSGDFRSADL